VRLGFAQNAAGTAPASVLFSRSIFVTAGSKEIESGMVPTKWFCWKRLHRNRRDYVNPMRCDRSKLYRRAERAAIHAHEVHELADRGIDGPVERVPRQVAARIPQAPAPCDKRRTAPLCYISEHYSNGRPGWLH
jgi:hypothetical protein